MSIETGVPAFPAMASSDGLFCLESGMTLRQYAAIKLKVPNSGTDWLDEMILESLRSEFAGQALVSMLTAPTEIRETTYDQAAKISYRFADAMLKARGES